MPLLSAVAFLYPSESCFLIFIESGTVLYLLCLWISYTSSLDARSWTWQIISFLADVGYLNSQLQFGSLVLFCSTFLNYLFKTKH